MALDQAQDPNVMPCSAMSRCFIKHNVMRSVDMLSRKMKAPVAFVFGGIADEHAGKGPRGEFMVGRST
jgi:hypothetical protein